MKIAVTVMVCHQVGIEMWEDSRTTKVFEENSTIKEINDWIKSIDNNSSFANAKISLCVE